MPSQCPKCGHAPLTAQGQATQRLEEALSQRFAGYPIVRVDRDVARSQGRLRQSMTDIARGEAALLVGTQMLAKGHDFPNVTLVVIVNGDAGLFAADYRGPERAAQLIVQVAGRAGRRERPGEVLLQTYHPQHAVIRALIEGGYETFAAIALAERAAAGWPPYLNMALVRAEGRDREKCLAALQGLKAALDESMPVRSLGPIAAMMERRAGQHRFHLALLAKDRRELHRALEVIQSNVKAGGLAHRVRIAIDVDPLESM